ncbi:hypothetical protein GALMADRAFT_238564 [Galerina marginata CBS 339.88]|uniref:ABM domain-containing protein n=1 Tax=Galerina marginata (strain CBS 339.88) TaxID=685588 RepID=A0A067TV96_GALM3|nr:hypothetical protein GALMADRAFT_238564 [Galerina marginata CBS 339.88]
MTVATEFLSFNASGGLLADPSLAEPTYQYLKKADGCLSVRYGFQVEETRLLIIITWETYGHYQRITEREDYAAFITALPTNLASSLQIEVVEFNGDTSEALASPVTDTSIVTVKEGQTEQDINTRFTLTNEMGVKLRVAEHPDSKYPTLMVWGVVKDMPGSYIFLCGWDSIETHREYLKRSTEADLAPELQAIFSGLIDLDVRHVSVKTA